MAVDKRCAASGKALHAESAASEIQHWKIYLRKTLQNRSKCMHKRRFVVISLLQYFQVEVENFDHFFDLILQS